MRLLILLGLLLLAGGGRAQIQPPPPCPGADFDREVFLPYRHAIKFHLRFHVGADRFDTRMVIERHRHEGSADSCDDPHLMDVVIAELARQRTEVWPR